MAAPTFSQSARTVPLSLDADEESPACVGNPSTGGFHDLGGVPLSDEGPLVVADHPKALWEKQIDALRVFAPSKGLLNVDMLRRAIESLEPEVYKSWSYYGKWAAGMCRLFIERGALTQKDLDEQLGEPASDPTPRFEVGQKVRVKPEQAKSRWRKPHLRVPGYIYNAHGVVERLCGVFKNPEALAFSLDASAVQPLYRIRFAMREVWPAYPGPGNDTIDVEIYQHWLVADDGPEPAPSRVMAHAGEDGFHNHAHGEGDGHDHPSHGHGHGHGQSHDHGHSHDHPSAGSSHGHDHSHAHSHGPDSAPHVHESRAKVEQTAVDREGPEQPDEHFAKCFLAACYAKGICDPATIATYVERRDAVEGRGYGPKIVAKAWTDPAFHALLMRDAAAAASQVGVPLESELMAVENTPKAHNLIVCTLCSCYPRSVLGLPPDWYKSRLYRSRSISDPRGMLRESFGLDLPNDIDLRVHDSTADMRYIVLPMRPAGTEGWTEEQLAGIVTRDAMVGVSVVPDQTGQAPPQVGK